LTAIFPQNTVQRAEPRKSKVYGTLTRETSASASAAQQDNAVSKLEKLLLANPGDIRAARNLITILDFHEPSALETGAYTDCQRTLSSNLRGKNWIDEAMLPGKMADRYKQWQDLLDSKGVTTKLPIAQLFMGRLHAICGESANCGQRLSLFEKKGVISKVCNHCYKVQILPLGLVGFMQIYFVLRKLELPNDNARKCMVELREEVPYPYKGYIYCDSEEEAKNCLNVLQSVLKETGITSVYCGISHGCSEYGLVYPEFKYSNDGAHRSFEWPAAWDRLEEEYWVGTQAPVSVRADHNKQGLSIRDVIGFCTWIDFAEIIGDETSRVFRDKPRPDKPARFVGRVLEQSARRRAELEELRQKISSAV